MQLSAMDRRLHYYDIVPYKEDYGECVLAPLTGLSPCLSVERWIVVRTHTHTFSPVRNFVRACVHVCIVGIAKIRVCD